MDGFNCNIYGRVGCACNWWFEGNHTRAIIDAEIEYSAQRLARTRDSPFTKWKCRLESSKQNRVLMCAFN